MSKSLGDSITNLKTCFLKDGLTTVSWFLGHWFNSKPVLLLCISVFLLYFISHLYILVPARAETDPNVVSSLQLPDI